MNCLFIFFRYLLITSPPGGILRLRVFKPSQLEAQPSPHSTLPALGEEELGGSASLRRRRSHQALRLPPADRHVFGAAPSLRSDTPRRPEEELLPKRSPPSPLHPRAGCLALFPLMLGFAMATVLLSSPPPLLTSQCGGRLCCQIGTDFPPNLATLAADRNGREIWPNLATLEGIGGGGGGGFKRGPTHPPPLSSPFRKSCVFVDFEWCTLSPSCPHCYKPFHIDLMSDITSGCRPGCTMDRPD